MNFYALPRKGDTMESDAEQGNEQIEILLIEPNPGDCRLFAESFKEAKITNTLHTVSDGEAALDFIHQRGEYADSPRPDLVLLEPQLPGAESQDVLTALKDDAFEDVPVVVLSSSDTEEDILKSHAFEADHYLQKPIETGEFVEFVQSVEDFWLAIVQ